MGWLLTKSGSVCAAMAAVLLLTSAAAAEGAFELVRASGPSPFAPGCNGAPPTDTGTLYRNAEVEPYVSVDTRNSKHIIGVWQQDRWSNGGANGLLTGVSRDGGQSWKRTFAHFTRCAGGNSSNGGDFERASDPWVSFSPNGTAQQISLSFNNTDANQAILVSRSRNGGLGWSEPIALTRDTSPDVGLDKESLTADPHNSRFAYAVWDRLVGLTTLNDPSTFFGPAWFSRTTDGGATWEPARIIYDPGSDTQTIGSQIVVLPNGDLVNMFILIKQADSAPVSPAFIAVMRSRDRGETWSTPAVVFPQLSIGITDVKTKEPLRTEDFLADIAVDPDSGALYLTWQDSRFSGGKRDGIAFSKSVDGGSTWSEPVQVNKATGVQAFLPTVAAAGEGAISLTYYDFRKDTADPATLLTTVWLSVSRDGGKTWHEKRLAGPFDMRTAPKAGGFFVGDYQALGRLDNNSVLPFFVQANSGNTLNPTDVFAAISNNEDGSGNGHQEVNAAPQSTRERLRSHREIQHGAG
jgi:hypothetical protein